MVNLNANVGGVSNPMKVMWGPRSIQPQTNSNSPVMPKVEGSDDKKTDFADMVKNYISNVSDVQQSSNMSIKDLLSGKNEDITSVVSAVAKADISFKLLVGVRNKLIEAYKQTMNMPL